MKKNGFTLAEVLITLTIVGVIAAITLPTLTIDTVGAQIGPKLAKSVAMLEQAHEALLNANSVDSLSDTGWIEGAGVVDNEYYEQLREHIKINEVQTNEDNWNMGSVQYGSFGAGLDLQRCFLAKDGTMYAFNFEDRVDNNLSPHLDKIGNLIIDVNGLSRPNLVGEDIFGFAIYNDGSLKPVGATNWDEEVDDESTWNADCAVNRAPTNPIACTGHIFENNLKLLYR